MKRILIDDNMVTSFENGNRVNTYLEITEENPVVTSPELVVLELTYADMAVDSYRLVEVEILPNGEESVRQEYILAPDIAYSLFKLFEKWDQEE